MLYWQEDSDSFMFHVRMPNKLKNQPFFSWLILTRQRLECDIYWVGGGVISNCHNILFLPPKEVNWLNESIKTNSKMCTVVCIVQRKY